jgi:N-acetylglutamate synthase-like GNAT family acetyltransferase
MTSRIKMAQLPETEQVFKTERVCPGAEIEIRSATAKDVPFIVELDERATGQAKRRYWRELFDHFSQLRGDGRAFLVAEHQGRMVGYIAGEIRAFEFGAERCGWVFALNVDQDIRVNNVGTRLFETLCETFKGAGVEKVRTMVDRDNHLVLAFFRSLGMMTGPFIQVEKDLD